MTSRLTSNDPVTDGIINVLSNKGKQSSNNLKKKVYQLIGEVPDDRYYARLKSVVQSRQVIVENIMVGGVPHKFYSLKEQQVGEKEQVRSLERLHKILGNRFDELKRRYDDKDFSPAAKIKTLMAFRMLCGMVAADMVLYLEPSRANFKMQHSLAEFVDLISKVQWFIFQKVASDDKAARSAWLARDYQIEEFDSLLGDLMRTRKGRRVKLS